MCLLPTKVISKESTVFTITISNTAQPQYGMGMGKFKVMMIVFSFKITVYFTKHTEIFKI